MMCRRILRGITAELLERICARAFPAETAHGRTEEMGPLDDPEGAEGPSIGGRLSDEAEKKQELLDSLRLDGFPENE